MTCFIPMLHPHSLYYDHLKPGEIDFLKKTADFCAQEIAPHAADWEEKEELPRDLFTKAGRAGLMEGDLIVAFDGTPTPGIDSLHRLLTAERIGKPAELAVLRRTEKHVFHVTPAARPPAPKA